MMLLMAAAMDYRQSVRPDVLEELMARLAHGDRDALAELYERTRTAVYGLALSYLKSGTEADDVTQDTFVRAWEHAPSYRPQGTPLAWLLAIARNLSLMRLREQGKVTELAQDDRDAAFGSDRSILTAEDRVLLRGALERLGEQERRIVLLHAATGLKFREVAQLLDLPLSTVLSKYHRAIPKLRAFLSEEGIT